MSKTQFRRCHKCGSVQSNTNDTVKVCSHCGKHLAPQYYFNEKVALGLSHAETELKPTSLPHKEYPPIFGVMVFWDDN